MAEAWPALPLDAWKDTYETLHRWIQIVGKVRLAQSPWLNHSWHATLYVTPRGLTTGPIPYGATAFQVDFDFLEQQLVTRSSNGDMRTFTLRAQSVAAFYREMMTALQDLNLPVKIHPRPNELARRDTFRRRRATRDIRPRRGAAILASARAGESGVYDLSRLGIRVSAARYTSSGARWIWR